MLITRWETGTLRSRGQFGVGCLQVSLRQCGSRAGKLAVVLSGCSGLEDTEWQKEEAMQREEQRVVGDLDEESSATIECSPDDTSWRICSCSSAVSFG